MIIENNLSKLVVFAEDSILSALNKMNVNKMGTIFSVSSSGKLDGILTDGDFRRWLVSGAPIDLELPVTEVCNKAPKSLSVESDHKTIEAAFNERVKLIPLIDAHARLISIAISEPADFKIGQHQIGDEHSTFIIAEIGNNHNGSLDLAKTLIDEAVAAGADCAKFQMRSMNQLYVNNGSGSNAAEDLGAQYTLDLLARFQLKNEAMIEAFDYCKSKGILPLCTPWDADSLALLENYGMPAYKLASADLTNHELLEAMAKTGKPIIASTGMSDEAEIATAANILQTLNAQYVLLHCNSTYPAPFKDVNLNYMERLKKVGNCPVGYSGHERGIAVPIAAVAKGACVIEKHFTMDRNMEGNDHRVSLLPSEFKEMVDAIRDVEEALGSRNSRKITQGEMMNREILAKSLVINCDLKEGQEITAAMIDVRSPGKGLSPYRKQDLIGQNARHDFAAGDFFYPSDVDAARAEARDYNFQRPFGIPVRYHDLGALSDTSNFDILEFHFSYKDMDEKPQDYLSEKLDLGLVVHSPELFEGDHIMDLCNPDPEYRQRSINELQRVVDITRELKPFFNSERPAIIINAGGFSMDSFIDSTERDRLHDLIADSLAKVDQDGIEIIPQTMPPFPWHFGGQRFHNLFMLPSDIKRFCEQYDYRICLDISHSQLACNHFNISFRDFLEEVGEYSAHLHVVDAEGVDGEGLQIGEGMVDFGMVAKILNEKAPEASFIPEVWQGHKNGGEGFWVALQALEPWY